MRLAATLLLVAGCGPELDQPMPHPSVTVDPPAATAAAGSTVEVAVRIKPARSAVTIESAVLAGGGSVEAATTNAGGEATVRWTLGVVPVLQRLQVGPEDSVVTIDVEEAAALTSEPFSDVPGFLDDAGIEASTEDLVFTGGKVVLNAGDGLLEVAADGAITRRELTGEPVERAWGLAAADDGTIWLVDAGTNRLLRVGADGEVSVARTGDGEKDFEGLNDVEVGPDGQPFATDPCLGVIVRHEPGARRAFDRATQGGPNGLAFDAVGTLFVSTENTSILCDQPDVAEFDAPLAGIYRLEITEEGIGEPNAVATELGVFGDGLTFDDEGNLYAIIDTLDGLSLSESAVVVLPGAMAPARKVVAAKDVLYANLAFGEGEFGETTLYLGLLQIAIFTGPESRGLQRVDLGIAGAPWL